MRSPYHIEISFMKECFSYNYETGELRWLLRPRNHFSSASAHVLANSRCYGKIAGSIGMSGYLTVKVNGKRMQCHRIAYAIHHGKSPDDYLIDHINGNKTDNRICNLRIATVSQNAANKINKPMCITWHKKSKKWQASVKQDNKSIYLGLFSNKDDALCCAQLFRREIFKEFAA